MNPRWAGLVALVTGVQYLVLEAVAAAAWTTPSYRYAVDYISDLGAAGSPSAAVMNTAFVLQGLGFLVVGLVVAAHVGGPRRYLVAAFTVAHAVGNVLVAAFPSSSGSGLHLVGAVLAIVGGNAAAFAASHGRFRWLGVLPVLGLLCAPLIGRSEFHGLWERGSVYSITLWEIAFGVLLLVNRREPSGRRLGESPAL
ncbi:DUF998 domain-containing protein [Umezawaea endophytica]|uniref:DUF998 domain-containing protein n=1 Tax=Umezawaea endophytica TaxID=1654476 RepID=A0A9X2VLL7_9PSEU|nr:DUF998 domain-containing protein [Umezawaea endophytica]MCS7478782.1 DUF998 domain-containing protein [Umezawaea endophytica]